MVLAHQTLSKRLSDRAHDFLAFLILRFNSVLDHASAWILSAPALDLAHATHSGSYLLINPRLLKSLLFLPTYLDPLAFLSIVESNCLFAFENLVSRDKVLSLNPCHPLGVLQFFSTLHLPGTNS